MGAWGTPRTRIRSASRQGSADVRSGYGRTPTRSRGAPTNSGRSRSGGRVQRGQSPLWWGLGEPPNPYPLRFPPGKWADVRSGDGRTPTRGRAPLRIRDGAGPAGESREGGALSGRGLGNPQTSIRSASRQGSGRARSGDGRTPTRGRAPPRIRDGAGPAGESREGGALFGRGLGNPQTSICSASRQGSRWARSGDGRTAVRPYEFGPEGRFEQQARRPCLAALKLPSENSLFWGCGSLSTPGTTNCFRPLRWSGVTPANN